MAEFEFVDHTAESDSDNVKFVNATTNDSHNDERPRRCNSHCLGLRFRYVFLLLLVLKLTN
jgi:hypothetical protein